MPKYIRIYSIGCWSAFDLNNSSSRGKSHKIWLQCSNDSIRSLSLTHAHTYCIIFFHWVKKNYSLPSLENKWLSIFCNKLSSFQHLFHSIPFIFVLCRLHLAPFHGNNSCLFEFCSIIYTDEMSQPDFIIFPTKYSLRNIWKRVNQTLLAELSNNE